MSQAEEYASRYPPVFVVGTGRCGSTLLSEMMRLHPRVLSISEWFTVMGGASVIRDDLTGASEFWRLLTVPSDETSELLLRYPKLPEWRLSDRDPSSSCSVAPLLMIPLPHLASDADSILSELRVHILSQSAQKLASWHSSAFDFLARRGRKTMWVERSGGSLAYVDILARSWRRARFIHIYRDGLSCARSMQKHPYFRVRVARALARRALSIGECLEMRIPIEQFAAYWSAVLLRGLRALTSVRAEDVLHIAYRDLVENTATVLARLQHFLERSATADEWIERAMRLVKHPVAQVTGHQEHETEQFHRICRIGMHAISRAEQLQQ